MNLGFVGLGDMGSLIVPRLMAAGHEVTGWNRTKSKADELIAQGVKWADTPSAAASDADFVFSILTDGPAVTEVALGTHGIRSGLRKGAIYIDMSTIAPEESRCFADQVSIVGVRLLDAPVYGSVGPAKDGTLGIMVGGDRAVFEQFTGYFHLPEKVGLEASP